MRNYPLDYCNHLILLPLCNYAGGVGETRWWKYVNSIAGDVQNTEIADRVGIDKSDLTRWARGSRPTVEFVLKFARKYKQPVIVALAAAEYITDSEADIREVKVGVRDLSTVDLARELLERVEASSESHSPGPERGTRTVVNDLGLHVIKVTQ